MENNPPQNHGKNWFRYFQYQEDRDSAGNARNILLVVVALIATVTFEASTPPPGGIWQDNRDGHKAGWVIYAADTLALSASILVLTFLTEVPVPFRNLVATVSLIVTYGSAVFAVTPDESVRCGHCNVQMKYWLNNLLSNQLAQND